MFSASKDCHYTFEKNNMENNAITVLTVTNDCSLRAAPVRLPGRALFSHEQMYGGEPAPAIRN